MRCPTHCDWESSSLTMLNQLLLSQTGRITHQMMRMASASHARQINLPLAATYFFLVGGSISQGGCQADRWLRVRSSEGASARLFRGKCNERFRLLNGSANAIHHRHWNSLSHFRAKPCQARPRQENDIRLIFFNGATRQLHQKVRLLLLHLRDGAE